MATKTHKSSKNSGEDTYSYKGWLNSDSFMKRAFAIYGYGIIPGLIIGTIFSVIFMFFWLIAMLLTL
tara:strand:+ start:99 stop:299 length:201 start_codon:yes stop_codon:yes gene_type:complete